MLEELLISLTKEGCFPSIYRRGKQLWRAHVNTSGNFWADGRTPLSAMRKAVRLWKKANKPMDGMSEIMTCLKL